MKFMTNILWISFFSLIYAISCVNISKLKEMNKYQNFSGIGPPCEETISGEINCTLASGKVGQCLETCDIPQTRDAEICCHRRYRTLLIVFYCCEVGDNFGRQAAVGGIRTQDDEFPYMAALGWYSREKMFEYDYKCGGAFISHKFVLTAAHCSYINGIEPIIVLPGGNNLTEIDIDMIQYVIETVHVHPDYDDDFVYNDIALIQIISEHEGATIDLWRRVYNANTSYTAVGYGDTTFGGTSSDVLIKVFLQHFPTNDCQRFFSEEVNVPDGITNTQLCAKDPKNIMDTCQGDSGGPLIMTVYNKEGDKKNEYLMGITSFGLGCASSAPGVYTRVSAYTKWINETISPWRVMKSNEDKEKHYWKRTLLP